jgi:hypothetical protein
MEALVLTILSIFAFIGVSSTIRYFLCDHRNKPMDSDIKLIIYIPENSESKLEGIIRLIFLDEIPRRLGTDGKVYIVSSAHHPETQRMIEELGRQYPLEVLPDALSYCMITEKE